MKIHTVAALPLLIGSLLMLTACDRGEPGRIRATDDPVDVEVVTPSGAVALVNVAGSVRSTREADVATRLSGTVRQVPVDIGSTVAAGAALAILDDADVQAGMQRAEAEAERARAYHRRIASLAADGAATMQERDDALAGMRGAEASLEAARAQLDYVVIRAPFAGAVSARYVDPGDLAVPGMPVVTLVRPGTVEVEIDLPADIAAGIESGDAATVETTDGRRYPVTARNVSPALDRQSRRARVKLAFDETPDDLPAPGSFVRAQLPGIGTSSLWIPVDALIERGQLTGVYLVEGDHVRLRWVRTGEVRYPDDPERGAVEVLAGVEPDDLVVRRPSRGLTDGARVGEVIRVSWTAAEPGQ